MTDATPDTLDVALVQQQCGTSTAQNIRAVEHAIREAAKGGAQLVLLQELHNSRYFCQTEDPANFDLAETVPGPSSDRLATLAAELQLVIVASLFEKRAPGLYHNTAVVLERDGSLAGRYRKMHIPDDPGYYEKFYFTPGDLGFRPISTSVGRLGVLICWDQWFPEAARLMALAGADLLLYPTAIGWDASDDPTERQRQIESWLTIQRGHAVANALPLLACNRAGHEPHPSGPGTGIHFWGSSFACGPQGEIIAKAGNSPEILTAKLDMRRSRQIRHIWPFLRDRRIDAYEALSLLYDD